MNSIIKALLAFIVLAVVWWGFTTIGAAAGFPPLIMTIGTVLLVIVAVVWLVQLIGGHKWTQP